MRKDIKRREFLKGLGFVSLTVAARAVTGFTIADLGLTRIAQAEMGLPLTDLRAALNPDQALLLLKGDAGDKKEYEKYLLSHNKRFQVSPEARVLCRTPQAMSTVIQWAATNKVPFAIRGGGHSYEGFCQSPHLVIDGRLMADIDVDPKNKTFSAGSGAALGNIYKALAPHNLAVPAGSCPTVGVGGHSTGGGFGLLGRAFGLNCDSVLNYELVDAKGRILNANDRENPDLFWALKGGGGSVAMVTRFDFQAHDLKNVVTFGISWVLSPKNALKVAKAWQEWGPNAPSQITSIFRMSKSGANISIRCIGQSIGTAEKLKVELAKLTKISAPTKFTVTAKGFLQAVAGFSGGEEYPVQFMKGKSDYVYEPLSDDEFLKIFANLPEGIAMICDAYGGKVAEVAPDATAFVHRKALYQIQYYTSWESASSSEGKLATMKKFHDSIHGVMVNHAGVRPSYVNYPDLDLGRRHENEAYALAYWGDNLTRLKEIKALWDPNDIFQHAQSIPR